MHCAGVFHSSLFIPAFLHWWRQEIHRTLNLWGDGGRREIWFVPYLRLLRSVLSRVDRDQEHISGTSPIGKRNKHRRIRHKKLHFKAKLTLLLSSCINVCPQILVLQQRNSTLTFTCLRSYSVWHRNTSLWWTWCEEAEKQKHVLVLCLTWITETSGTTMSHWSFFTSFFQLKNLNTYFFSLSFFLSCFLSFFLSKCKLMEQKEFTFGQQHFRALELLAAVPTWCD